MFPRNISELQKTSKSSVRKSVKLKMSCFGETSPQRHGAPERHKIFSKLKNCEKRFFQNQIKKMYEKTPQMQKKIAERNPNVTPSPSSYPGRATPAHPQSRVSAKALESLLKLFAMVCSIHFVLARRIGGLSCYYCFHPLHAMFD